MTAHPWGPSMLLQTQSSIGKLATQVQVLTRAQLTMGWWVNPLSFQVSSGQGALANISGLWIAPLPCQRPRMV